jgi:hypothetical protein
MSDTPDEPTEPTDAVDAESAADFAPPRPEDAAPVRATGNGVDTVSRKGALLAMAGCLVVGLLLGWGVAAATQDDGDSQPISFQGGRGDGDRGPGDFGRGGPEGGFDHGFPGPQGPGGFPGPFGPGGGEFDQRGGFPGGPPGYDEHDDDGDGGERGTDEPQDEDDSPSTTEQGD